jgi:hypothetical protein
MRIKLILVAAIALGLGGCAFRTNTVMRRDMNALVGKDVHLIVKRLGYPERHEVIMGDDTYVWRLNDCTLIVGVDKAERVTHFDYNGSRRECSYISDRIDDDDEEYRSSPPKPSAKPSGA